MKKKEMSDICFSPNLKQIIDYWKPPRSSSFTKVLRVSHGSFGRSLNYTLIILIIIVATVSAVDAVPPRSNSVPAVQEDDAVATTIHAKGPCDSSPPKDQCPPPRCPPPPCPPPPCPPPPCPPPPCPPKCPPPPCPPPPCPPKCPPPPCPPPKEDRCGGGDAPAIRICKCKPDPCSTGDRGKTGAGVTGSRGGRGSCPDEKLPAGSINPGLLRHIHNAARNRLPQCFEGGSLSVKQTSCNWTLGHSLSFSSVSPGGYKLLMSYTDKKTKTSMPYFVMEAAPGGQVSCEMRVGPTNYTRATVVAQIADAEFYSFESILDAYFNRFTASIIAVNREFIALHYLQAITSKISLGAEIVARGSSTELSSASGAGRWASGEHSVSATLGNRGLDLCYARDIKPFLTVAAMLEVGFKIRRAVATLAYEWHTREWTVRGSVDSDGLVGATLQRCLGGQNAQLSCAISALLNHPNDKFRLGFGVTAAII